MSRPGDPDADTQPVSARSGDTRPLANDGSARPRGRPPKVTVTRVAMSRTRHLSRRTAKTIGDAARSGGAGESGLTRLIWLNVVQTGADAMMAVALANTIFFSAATSQQRSNVALYLLITMAPFALVAPIIGPLLDRLQHGRRYALAVTAAGRGVLALVMAQNFHNLALYPAIFGFLVLSKAYGVLKASCVPRILPSGMTLVSANARLSIFALGGTTLFGGLAVGLVRLGGSPWALRVTVLVFLAAATLALRLPRQVDSSAGEVAAPILRAQATGGRWRGRRLFGPQTVVALRGSAALRGLSGFLTLFLAFLVQHQYDGFTAVLALGAVAVAAGGGSFIGTASGARLRLGRPDVVVLACVSGATTMLVVTAIAYNIEFAIATALVAGTANSLGKLSLDAIIQRDLPDALRASAFGRSETLLQLSWVVGGGIGIGLPTNGRLGFGVAAAVLAAALVVSILGFRRTGQVVRSHGSARMGEPQRATRGQP